MTGKVIDPRKSSKELGDFTFTYDEGKLQSGVYIVEVEMTHQKDHALMIVK